MSYIQNLFTSRDNNAQGNTYVGQEGRIWWNPDTNAFYYSDGNTAGGIPVGTGGGGGNGVPGGPTNSIQYNAGNSTFGGTANLVVSGTGLSAVGNITAAWFIGNVSTTGNIVGGNILSNNYLYSNGQSIFANIQLTGNIDLGNLYIIDQTVYGKNLNANIGLSPEGDGWVTVPKIDISGMTVANTGTAVQFDTNAGIDIQFGPGAGGNILTAGTIKPTGNNIAGIGDAANRYTDLWLGSGNINLIDQTLNQNQQIYANQGNLIFANSNGIKFGEFEIFDTTISTIDANSNIIIGKLTSNAYVEINRPLTVNSTGGSGIAFQVERSGLTQINAPEGIPANSPGAFNIVASTDGAYQNVTNSGGMIHITGPENSAARVTVDAYGTIAGSGAPGVLVFRSARGNATTPTATQANDTLARISAVGWGNTPGFGAGATLAATAVEFVAAETFTPTAQGSKITFNTANIGSNSRSVSATIQANGLSFVNNTNANSGITFNDGSFQNTAYIASQAVNSVTVGVGLQQNQTTGNITIDNTGVLQATGTPQQVRVNGSYTVPQTGNIVLGLPQDIATNSTPTFANLTVTGNLYVVGNTISGNTIGLNGKILYLANNSASNSDINFGGIALGNVDATYSRTILYDLTNNRWTTAGSANNSGISNFYSPTLYSANVATDYLDVTYTGHFGTAYDGADFAHADIQAYSNVNNFSQIVNWNKNSGASASADFVAVNDLGNTDNDIHYIDLGINSSTYANAGYVVSGPNDGYLYVNGGNLVIGTQTTGNTIKFHTGGTDNTNYIRATLSDTGLSVAGNVTANNYAGNTVAVTTASATTFTGTTVSVTGVITGSSITGSVVSATGTITGGNLRTGGSISATGNATVGNLITATTTIDGGVSTSGTVTAANINGANITASGTVSAIGNISTPNLNASIAIVSTLLSITGNIDGGNLRTSGIISTTGNATFGNVQTTGRVSVTGNIDGGNVRSTGIVTATGNISTAGYFLGDGGLISNITATTGTKIVNGTSWANIVTSGGNLVMAIGGNTIGTISAGGANITGYANASGNVTGGNLVGQNLTPTRVTFVGSGKEIDDDAEFTYNDTTNTLSVGNISTTGNVTAAYFTGNGSGLTGTVGGSRYFGSFLSTTTQTNTSAGNALPMTFDTAEAFNSGVQLGSPTPNSRIIINNPGVYNIQFSAQLDKTDAGVDTVDIWLSQDGVNVPNTNTTVTLSGNDDKVVAAWNFLVQTTTANSYFQLYWTSIDTNLRIFAQGTQINPTRPAIPSVILTVTQA